MALVTRLFSVKLLYLLIISLLPGINVADLEGLNEYSLANITAAVKSGCVLAALKPALKDTTLHSIFQKLSMAFKNESRVNVGVLSLGDASKISWERSTGRDLADYSDLAFFPRKKSDRACLIRPAWEHLPKAQIFRGSRTVQELLAFLNENCETFRQQDGSLSPAGLLRRRILKNLYRVPKREDLRHDHNSGPVNIGGTCERIPLPSKEKFFNEYFFRSKPVVITGEKNCTNMVICLESFPITFVNSS